MKIDAAADLEPPVLLDGLQLRCQLVHRRYVEKIGKISVSGERVTLLSFHQNLYSRNSRDICREGLNQRSYSEVFFQHSRSMTIGEGCVDVDYR